MLKSLERGCWCVTVTQLLPSVAVCKNVKHVAIGSKSGLKSHLQNVEVSTAMLTS